MAQKAVGDAKRIKEVMRALDESRGLLSAEEAATLTQRSKRTLRQDFTRIAGMNFRTARVKVKLEHGAVLLGTTELTIPDISQELGYSDRAKFENAFKHAYGVTPTQYRRHIKSE
jgi:AraC-like DNA-binding protein